MASLHSSLLGSASMANLAALESEKAMLEHLRSAQTPRYAAQSQSIFSVAQPLLQQGYSAMVDDSFARCFKTHKKVDWNWNIYLWPIWALGVAVRYGILFPLRLCALIAAFSIIGIGFPIVKLLAKLTRQDFSKWEI